MRATPSVRSLLFMFSRLLLRFANTFAFEIDVCLRFIQLSLKHGLAEHLRWVPPLPLF